MWEFIDRFFSWLRNLWTRLSVKDRETIIDAVVEAFGHVLRVFFKQWAAGRAR
jgi:hypothetical protein